LIGLAILAIFNQHGLTSIHPCGNVQLPEATSLQIEFSKVYRALLKNFSGLRPSASGKILRFYLGTIGLFLKDETPKEKIKKASPPRGRKKFSSRTAHFADHAGDLVVGRRRRACLGRHGLVGGMLVEPRLDLEVDLVLQRERLLDPGDPPYGRRSLTPAILSSPDPCRAASSISTTDSRVREHYER